MGSLAKQSYQTSLHVYLVISHAKVAAQAQFKVTRIIGSTVTGL